MAKLPPRLASQRSDTVRAVIDAMSTRGLRWLQEWSPGASPHNATTGIAYRGINRLHLAFAARARGFDDPRWATFRQAKERGWHVKKGARSHAIERWKTVVATTKDDDGNPTTHTVLRCVGHYSVFNLAEIDGSPPYEPDLPALTQSTVMDVADRLILSSRCPVTETTEGRACYSPTRDLIVIPRRELFLGRDDAHRAQSFVRTLAHEMTHSTMRPLSRDMSDYALEELVAELGSMFVCADLHVPLAYDLRDEHYNNHVAYLQSWSSGLADVPDALFSAAAHADRAAAFIADRYRDTHRTTASAVSVSA